ncbi:MAG: hypothetical protein KZQ62_12260 [Candidatus Thiodiazotropha sp. (ex Lucinoma aequizonata)]|nr:hypothetical protein [Candidatus Thiodiazotropha sp. (ex Lucinoma aequizonata)]MCU7897931.1 hypothetical protein [Candidatus Thiodiazotropha sp. (ex Lucinoma aequizonata)]MCU7907495.1 hypothetical protein [Candidatus Thiodiazotropha sp. (ex Lucinoma aequizonata)]
MLNSHLIGFLALAKERVRLLPFGWHPGTQLLGAHLNSYVFCNYSAHSAMADQIRPHASS